MLKRKVSVYLQRANAVNDGMSVYLNEIVLRLAKYNDLSLEGVILQERALRSCYDPTAYSRFKFPLKIIPMPVGLMFGTGDKKKEFVSHIIRPFLYSYNFWAGDSDVYLFLGSRCPLIPIRGKVISCLHDISQIRTPELYKRWEVDFSRRAFTHIAKKSTRIIK